MDAQQRLKRFVERERKMKNTEQKGQDHGPEVEPNVMSFERIAMDILEHIVAQRNAWDTGTTDCLGRNLCHLSRASPGEPHRSHLETVAMKIATTVLLWVQLDAEVNIST